ncbi:hypothetical protein A2696_03375 [Candidatus Curtissbacteria bacterium RIFCSPHIGHO2_01_FULL_41_13]|uniref:O-antigen ligase-related domain-containing protein n=1 Tax=Candidatus Curtissbacteria bacterium RIFCSPHIGHO2_01_FULL_41_13 TaxID=1797745 RepID=A0A1F5G157_9BACT|nr:MAG: hypothetical protein A2696_03375 [Candidatus Curtissbacteria bacterium RIFCSPHIGHO2_01_FULL_41_13]
MNIVKLFLITTLFSIIIGQLIRFPLASTAGAITLTDILVIVTDILFLLYAILLKSIIRLPKKTFFYGMMFSLAALTSTILAANFFSFSQIITASFFLFRFVAYFFISVVVYNIIKKNQIGNWINFLLLLAVVFSSLGFLQLLILPDLSFLVAYGWDPHQERIVSTFLDPNFAGIAFAIFLAFSTSLYLYKKNYIYLGIAILLLFVLVFTYSRSSYLALITVMFVIGVAKAPKLIILTLLFFLTSVLVSAHIRERIVGAATLDETAQARVESWQKALTIFKNNFLFGTGFNTYRFAQSKQGNFAYDNPQGGHSGSGTDSSILLVAATTGIFGLSFFSLLIFSILQFSFHNLKTNYLKLASFSSILAILVHSQFVNSFFFPQIMLLIWFIVGINHVQNN